MSRDENDKQALTVARQELAAANAEVERLRVCYEQECALTSDLAQRLAAALSAKDAACDIAEVWIDVDGRIAQLNRDRIAKWRQVGKESK